MRLNVVLGIDTNGGVYTANVKLQSIGSEVTSIRVIVERFHALLAPREPKAIDLAAYGSIIQRECGKLWQLVGALGDVGIASRQVELQNVFVPADVFECKFDPAHLEVGEQHVQLRGSLASADSSVQARLNNRYKLLQQARVPALKALNNRKSPFVVLLGGPGIWKSSVLRMIALNWASNSATQAEAEFPISSN